MEDILQEARGLAESGVKELIVVAQDTSRYGTDLYGAPRLPLLLHELCRIEGFHWIRVHYLYPDMITDELLDTFASEPKLVNYMDIPIQHVNDAILRRMNRRGTRAELESSGKTTLALHVLAEAQKRGGEVAFVDAEHALDPVYAAAIGVDIDSMLVSQPDTGEQALDITDALVRSGAIDVVVVDSVAALTPRAEIEGEMGEAFVGLQARLMSQALRKLAGTVSKTNCIVIFINQLRMKIGVMYGNPETTTGGNALKFYSSVRLDVRKIEAIKSGTEIVGNRTRVKVIKNKCAPPFREAVFDIMYGEGISRFGELLDIAVTLELVNKSGSWFSVGDERIGQGRDNAKQYIADHPELAAELEARVRAHLMEVQNSRIKQPAAPAKPVDVSADDFDAE